MPYLSPADVTALGNFVTGYALLDTCSILRKGARVSDGQGGDSNNQFTSVATPPCAVVDDGARATEPYQNAQLRSRVLRILLLPPGTDIRDSDRAQVGNVFYEVLGVLNPTSYEVVRRVVILKLGQGAS